MQPKTAQTTALKLPDMMKYLAISGFYVSTAIAVYLLTA
jgi:hypothetical protein